MKLAKVNFIFRSRLWRESVQLNLLSAFFRVKRRKQFYVQFQLTTAVIHISLRPLTTSLTHSFILHSFRHSNLVLSHTFQPVEYKKRGKQQYNHEDHAGGGEQEGGPTSRS